MAETIGAGAAITSEVLTERTSSRTAWTRQA
jgi:hypothetical protein